MLRAHHWDWLHALTFALALLAFGDAERQVVASARVATWPTAHAIITQSRIDVVRVPSARGISHALRLTAMYDFTTGGRSYSGRTVSWYPRSDAPALAEGKSIDVHYEARHPAINAVYAPPRFTVWLESVFGIVLLLASGLPWHRWRAHRDAALEDDDEPDGLPAVTLEVSADGVAIPSPKDLHQTITRVGG